MTLAELGIDLGVDLDDASFKRAEKAYATLKEGLAKVADRTNAFRDTVRGYSTAAREGVTASYDWHRGLSRVGSTVEALKSALLPVLGIVAGLGYGIAHAFGEVTDRARQINKLALAAGLSTDQFQALAYAAGQFGIKTDDLRQSFASLIANARDAADGQENYVRAFQRAGVKVTDGNGKLRSTDAILYDLADSFAAMPEGIDKAALAIKIFGEDDGPRILPFLNKSSAYIRKMGTEAAATGAILGKDTLDASVQAAAAWDSLKESAQGLLAQGFGPLMPSITAAFTELRKWIKENRADLVAAFGLAVRVVGVAFRVLLAVMRPVVSTLSALARYFNLIAITLGGALLVALIADAAAFGALGLAAYQTGIAMVVAAVKTAAAWALAAAPFLLILAVVGLIALIAEDIWVGMHGGKSFFGLIYNWIDKLPGMFADAMIEVGQAVKDWFVNFFNWFAEKARSAARWLNPFDSGENWQSGTRGATSGGSTAEDRAFMLSRGLATSTAPIPGAVSAPGGRAVRMGGGGPTIVMGAPVVHVHGVTDPKAVGEVVDKKLADHAQRQAEELHGALGGR